MLMITSLIKARVKLPWQPLHPYALPVSPDGVDTGAAALAFGLGDAVPLEGESPVEAADHGLVRLHVELEGVPVDGVDDGAHDGAAVLADPEGGRREGERERQTTPDVEEPNKEEEGGGGGRTHLSSRGSIQPGTHSQWQSKKVSTSPVA